MHLHLLDRFRVGDDCWEWTGPVDGSYGRYANRMAHRLVYEELVGPVPPDHDLHHRCGNRICVRPGHLQPLTRSEHMAIHYPPRPPRRNRYAPKSVT